MEYTNDERADAAALTAEGILSLEAELSPSEFLHLIPLLSAEQIHAYSVAKARVDFNVFAEMVCTDDETGEPIQQARIHREWAKLCDEHDRLLIWSHINSGKCEPAGARLLLASGEWTNIEDLSGRSVQLTLLDPATRTYRDASARVYENGAQEITRIETRSGSVFRATGNHPVFTPEGWREAGDVKPGDYVARARNIPEPVSPVEMQADDAELLGYLIADGGITDPHRVKFSKKDPQIVARVRDLVAKKGWVLSPLADGVTYSITREQAGAGGWDATPSPWNWVGAYGLQGCLSKHKRAPAQLFQACTKAVEAFVTAYLCSDGHVDEHVAEFYSASEGLLFDVRLLLLRLGVVSSISYKHARCGGRDFNSWRLRVGGEALRRLACKVSGIGPNGARLKSLYVSQKLRSPNDGVPAVWKQLHSGFTHKDVHKFKFPVKAKTTRRDRVFEYLKANPDPVVEALASHELHWDEVLAVSHEPAEMTYAVEVDDPAHCYLSSGTLSHNTTQLSILRTLWELGNDPTLRFVILSNTAGIATKIVKAIAGYVKNSEPLHQIFPDLKEDPEGPWTNTELKVLRKNNAKDPSVRAVGVHGSLTSGRVDRLIVDDILDPENTDTEANRKKVLAWYKAVAVGRQTRRYRVRVIGTAYHPKDLLHELAKQKGWVWKRFPLVSPEGKITWPELWSAERIEKIREELGPAEFARQLLCLARDDDEARFKETWITAARERGKGLPMLQRVEEMPEGCATFTGVDIGVSKKKRAAVTSLFTFMEDARGSRRVLNIEAGKFTGPQIVDKLIDHHERYQSIVCVENQAAQDFILQFARDISNVPVVPHTTTRAKRDPLLGVEGLAIELSNGKWIIPCDEAMKSDPEVEAWIVEMLFYSPAAHTGDRLMSCYFAREVARRTLGNRSRPGVALRLLGTDAEKAPAAVSGGDERRSIVDRLFDVPESSGARPPIHGGGLN